MRLISDHHVQKGAAFPTPLDVFIHVSTGEVTTRYQEKGKEQTSIEHMDLPADLANGIVLYFLKNIPPETKAFKLHFLASLPRPRLVQLAITRRDKEAFDVANIAHKATRFAMKVDLGGITGMIAPVIGKEPSEYNFWILDGEAPAFIRMEGQFFNSGPVWTLEMSSPVWPKAMRASQ